jgi:type II secretory pathway component PulM
MTARTSYSARARPRILQVAAAMHTRTPKDRIPELAFLALLCLALLYFTLLVDALR